MPIEHAIPLALYALIALLTFPVFAGTYVQMLPEKKWPLGILFGLISACFWLQVLVGLIGLALYRWGQSLAHEIRRG